MEHASLFLILATIFGFFMAWGVGANDVANAMGTSVGSKAITVKQAIIIAAIFEAAGALLAGGEVTNTLSTGIINTSFMNVSPDILIYGMLAALLAAGTWLLIASAFGWPVSTTHSIVGAIIGFGIVAFGAQAIQWKSVSAIALTWVITPLIAGSIAYLLFISVRRFIFMDRSPVQRAIRIIPIYIFIVTMIITLVTLTKGLKHLNFHFTTIDSLLIAIALSVAVSLIGALFLQRIPFTTSMVPRDEFKKIEKMFGVLMVFTACAMAFAHGSNDVANAIGPLAAIVSLTAHGVVTATAKVPLWILFLGAIGIITGLWMYGYRVMQTIGSNITQLTPSRGFAAQLATAGTVVIASGVGLPVSTTQTLVGAVLGVGIAKGIGALNLSVIRNIFMSWVITLPAGAILAIAYYFLIKALMAFFL